MWISGTRWNIGMKFSLSIRKAGGIEEKTQKKVRESVTRNSGK
jgi:hypothetical protein